jgi:polyisoprenoid-binding protein YceI
LIIQKKRKSGKVFDLLIRINFKNMKRSVILLTGAMLSSLLSFAQLFSTSAGVVSFFSKTPMEDISAETKTALVVFNSQTKGLAFSITNTSFHFENKLMEEHFNEKYIESEIFPKSTFSGTINEAIDLSKDGDYSISVTGKLKIHGVEQSRTITGTMRVSNGSPQFLSTFKVKNSDHKIEIPTIVTAKISEEIEVKVDAMLAPKK